MGVPMHVDMDPEQGQVLIDCLDDKIPRPDYWYEYHWQVRDLLVLGQLCGPTDCKF